MAIGRFLLLICMTACFSTMAQPADYRAPLDGILRLSGNFGEVRSGHFHSGLDLKTGGVEGKPVYAIADGEVVRVYVSPTGYGKAIYVEHPDGHTSVYAHLRQFSSEVATYVKGRQYEKQNFRVDLTIPKGLFPVKRGEVIAYSGNSGGSGAPHLHFEIRETNGQVPLNPLKFGFDIKDDSPPVMERLWVYSHSANGHVEGMAREHMVELEKGTTDYRLKGKEAITALGSVSFGIAALDRFTDSRNVCGIYTMTVLADSSVIHRHSIDRMPFHQKRKVNAYIDYSKRQLYRDVVHRSYIAPNNDLNIYETVVDGGMLHVGQGEQHDVSIALADFSGNRSTLQFKMKGGQWPEKITPQSEEVKDVFLPKEDNSFSTANLRLTIPKGCLYDTLRFTHSELSACKDCLAPVQAICDLSVPADDYMNVSLRIDGSVKAERSKLLIVSFDEKDKPVAEGGSVNGQWISVRTRSFGNYSVMQDTTPPQLSPKGFSNGQTTTGKDTLTFLLDDDLAGIASYIATLNGRWVLMEHDPKNSVIFYVKDERFVNGDNVLQITATDNVGNVSTLDITVR